MKIIDWTGGLKDGKGEWTSKPVDYDQTLKQFGGVNNAFILSAKFNHSGEFVVAGGGTG